MANTCKWHQYDFTIFTMSGTEWNDVAGIYIFSGVHGLSQWKAYYVGIADSFKNRLPNHERWAEAVRIGASHVHALVVQQEATRQAIEKELIRVYQPPLNTHHR